MNARFPPKQSVEARSRERLSQLLCLEEWQPPLDLRSGSYRSSAEIPRRYNDEKAGSLLAGLSMFCRYFRVVQRDRALALRGHYSDFLWARSGLELTRLFESYGARFQIEGLEQLRGSADSGQAFGREGPYVFAVNHMSTLETQTLCGYISPYSPVTFVVKDALAQGYFAPLICSRPYIALARRNPLQDLEIVLHEGSEILSEGRSVILFPQGTREENQFSRSRFNSIAARLAAKAGVRVVPVALSTAFWSRLAAKAVQYIPRLHPERRVHFAFGPPLAAEGRGRKAHKHTVEFISDHMSRWGIAVLD